LANNAKNLDELRKMVESFDGLAIKKTATNCVFGDGNPNSKIMLIGEAPGENEDLEGIPFCGVSGQLLEKMLKHVGFKRAENFYITNTIFWRPPGNRKPTAEELAICKPFLEKHIALINPDIIILIGATATLGVLESKDSISVMRKKISEYNNLYLKKSIPCFAIYHPSFLLRSASQKKVSWMDLIKIKKYISEKFS
jgi:DNA polymerase